MTVSISSIEKTGLRAKQDQITAVGARTDYQSVQHKAQLEAELVNSLLDQQKLAASSIISTLPTVGVRNPLYAKITAAAALVTSYGATPPGYAAALEKDRLERQLVNEEIASGQRTAASILSGMTVTV